MVQGTNQACRDDEANEFIGSDVHLLSSAPADTVTDATLSDVEATLSTSDSDWTYTHDNTAGTTVVETTSDLSFGETPDFKLKAIVLQSTGSPDEMVIDDAPAGDTDLTGDGDLTIPAGDISYTYGGQ